MTTEIKLKKMNQEHHPFLVEKDQELAVTNSERSAVVDSGKYEIKFRMLKTDLEELPKGAQTVGQYCTFTLNFDGITMATHSDLKIVDAIFKILPFFNNLKEAGDIEALSKEEMISLFAHADEEIHLAMYNLVATFLGINDHLGQHMLPFSVIAALSQLIDNHPEIFNQADVFFG